MYVSLVSMQLSSLYKILILVMFMSWIHLKPGPHFIEFIINDITCHSMTTSLLPWQQCFIANQNLDCHFTCHWNGKLPLITSSMKRGPWSWLPTRMWGNLYKTYSLFLQQVFASLFGEKLQYAMHMHPNHYLAVVIQNGFVLGTNYQTMQIYLQKV